MARCGIRLVISMEQCSTAWLPMVLSLLLLLEEGKLVNVGDIDERVAMAFCWVHSVLVRQGLLLLLLLAMAGSGMKPSNIKLLYGRSRSETGT